MRKKLPKLRSNKAAEQFVSKDDLTEYDLSMMKKVRFKLAAPRPSTQQMRLTKRQSRNP